ncbi:hypothetical protein E4U43_002869 [Claviceps pusilla]|uniref:Cholesterol oxidase n=1 Tax=Claviceps pusilla TaxID=123648 RepID=A0A9P7SY11_9HYPO|nr:hypothetical protein E4U43_002869 [Claviceps pusilla]
MRGATDDPLHGFVIQDGAVPEALARLVQPIAHLQTDPCPSGPDTGPPGLGRRLGKLGRVWKSRLLGPYARSGAVQKTQVFLVMSHDTAQGTMRLEHDLPILHFPTATATADESPREQAVHDLLSAAVTSVGGTLIRNPCSKLWGSHRVTVHPLGGARMSRDNTARNGVTDHRGRVFTGRTASETHAGLVVVDGAVVPGSLGVNPLATIAALAERTVAEFARAEGLAIREDSNGEVDVYSERPAWQGEKRGRGGAGGDADPAHVSFSECMAGFVDTAAAAAAAGDSAACFEACYGAGRAKAQAAQLLLRATISEDGGPVRGGYVGTVTGSVVCPTIRGSPFVAHNGRLVVFQPDRSVAGASRLVYDFDMMGVDGRRLHFHGYKIVDASASCRPRQLWRALTTLYVTVTRGPASGPSSGPGPGKAVVVARGILRMTCRDLSRQLRSLMATGDGPNRRASHAAVRRFVVYFLRHSASHLLVPLAPLQYPRPVRPGEFINPTRPSGSIVITASDGVQTVLHVWEPQPQSSPARHHHATSAAAPTRTENLLMIPGAAVTHHIFALPTVPVNAVNFFTRAGVRVFVAVHRIATMADTAAAQPPGTWTTYDARLDIKACFEHIRAVWSDRKLYTIAHCMGSVALASGLLDGTIPSDWLLGLTCSQVFMNPVWSASNVCKRTTPLALDKLFKHLSGEWFDCTASDSDRNTNINSHRNNKNKNKNKNIIDAATPPRLLPRNLLDSLLRIYPNPPGESCRSASCHRTTFLFGRCWSHANLNESTHRHIDKFFGRASMTLMSLLMHMPPAGITANYPGRTPLATPHNIRRLRGLPIFLFSGADNDVLSPAATDKTYEVLTRTFGLSAGMPRGGVQYRREVFAGYGHLDCWMGQRAYRDVFPVVAEEMWRVMGEQEHDLAQLERNK